VYRTKPAFKYSTVCKFFLYNIYLRNRSSILIMVMILTIMQKAFNLLIHLQTKSRTIESFRDNSGETMVNSFYHSVILVFGPSINQPYFKYFISLIYTTELGAALAVTLASRFESRFYYRINSSRLGESFQKTPS